MNATVQTLQKFNTTRKELGKSLVERQDEIDLALCAILAKGHIALVGPPGTAKTMMVNALTAWMDTTKFSYMLNKTTDPAELLGPVSVSGLKSDDYRRVTTHKMPEAEFVFLDEAFKANSACQNMLLTLMNERKFYNGKQVVSVPLRTIFAASNEWPNANEEVSAFYDRFLFRKIVEPVTSKRGLKRIMFDADLEPKLSTKLSGQELDEAQKEAGKVSFEAETTEAIFEIYKECVKDGLTIGNRRMRQSIGAIQAYAWMNGNNVVTNDDLEVLNHIWWTNPKEEPELVDKAIRKIAAPTSVLVKSLMQEANEATKNIDYTNISDASSASVKLSEIRKKLEKMNGKKAEQAVTRVTNMDKDIRTKIVNAMA